MTKLNRDLHCLEFLKIRFSNRSESTRSYVYLHLDPGGWPVVEVATLCGEHMRRTRPVHNQNHSHSWRQRAARSERNGKVKGEFSWFKSVFFEGIRLWEQQDQLLRKSSQIKLLKMLLESKKINKQLVMSTRKYVCKLQLQELYCSSLHFMWSSRSRDNHRTTNLS